MPELKREKIFLYVRRALASWYLSGLIGWTLLYFNYPLLTVIPRYAG